MVKIGIVDSGLDKDSRLMKDVIGGVGFLIENDTLYITDEYDDECGHGTQCAQVIKNYCEMAELYIVKIVNKSGVCDSILLLQALEHLCEIDVDIINVSLSVANDNYREEFEKIIYKLHNQGKIINISVRNGCQISFPADISNCYGIVGKTMNDIQYEFNADQDIQISSSLYPLFVPTISGMSQWFGGNSKATAMMSGIMGRWKCYKDADYDIVEKNLKKNIDSAIITNVEKQYTSLQKEKVFEKISAVIEKYYCDGMIELKYL